MLNKADALAGTLVDVQLAPSPQFRALVPAQQTTAQPGDPIWFVGAPYLGQGQTNNVIRVTELQDPFGSATLTDYFLPVDTYGGFSGGVDQPGGPGSVAANDNTTTQVFDYNGTLVTAFPASTAADGYFYPKVHYYEVNVTSGTPVLSLQGVIDPGPGVATFFPTVAMNPNTGDLGLTWMQSSLTEYVSMYVGTVSAATGNVGVTDAAPGVTTEVDSFRNGDYSTVVYDPGSDAFWAANEYAGINNASEIWNTWIAEFTPPVRGRYGLLLGQRQRRRQPALRHHDSGRRSQRVRQQLLPRAPALRPQWQSGRRRRRQRVRWPQLGDRLHGPGWRRRQVDHRGHALTEHAPADLRRIRPAGHRRDRGLVAASSSRPPRRPPARWSSRPRTSSSPSTTRFTPRRSPRVSWRSTASRPPRSRWSTGTRSTGRSRRVPSRPASTCRTS